MISRKFIYKFFNAKALCMIVEAFPCRIYAQNADAEAFSTNFDEVRCAEVGVRRSFVHFRGRREAARPDINKKQQIYWAYYLIAKKILSSREPKIKIILKTTLCFTRNEYFCSAIEESWQSDRMRRTRNPVYSLWVSGV